MTLEDLLSRRTFLASAAGSVAALAGSSLSSCADIAVPEGCATGDGPQGNLYKLCPAGSLKSVSPYGDSGLTWDGQHIWLLGKDLIIPGNDVGTTGWLYQLTPALNIVSSFKLPQQYPEDITWDGEHLWWTAYNNTTGDSLQEIFKYTRDGKEVASYVSPGTGVCYGIAWDGQSLWHLNEGDSATGSKMFKTDREMNVLDSFLLPYGKAATALEWDGSQFWHADFWNSRLQVTNPKGEITMSFPMPEGKKYFGVMRDGSHIWTTGYKNFKVDGQIGEINKFEYTRK